MYQKPRGGTLGTVPNVPPGGGRPGASKKPERFLRSGSGMLSQISFVVNQALNTFPASSMVT